MRTLVYVEKNLVHAIGSLLIGSSEANKVTGGVSINYLFSTHVESSIGSSRELKDLLPEQVFYKLYDKIPHKFENTKEATWALVTHEQHHIMPGTPVSVCGILSFPELAAISDYDPFHPPSIQVDVFNIHGDRCFVGNLEKDGYRLPVYFPDEAKGQVCFLQKEPVEIVGITKWSPGYKAGGGKSLNMLIRVAALLLG